MLVVETLSDVGGGGGGGGGGGDVTPGTLPLPRTVVVAGDGGIGIRDLSSGLGGGVCFGGSCLTTF